MVCVSLDSQARTLSFFSRVFQNVAVNLAVFDERASTVSATHR